MAQSDVDTTGSTSDLRYPLSCDSIPCDVKHHVSPVSRLLRYGKPRCGIVQRR